MSRPDFHDQRFFRGYLCRDIYAVMSIEEDMEVHSIGDGGKLGRLGKLNKFELGSSGKLRAETVWDPNPIRIKNLRLKFIFKVFS